MFTNAFDDISLSGQLESDHIIVLYTESYSFCVTNSTTVFQLLLSDVLNGNTLCRRKSCFRKHQVFCTIFTVRLVQLNRKTDVHYFFYFKVSVRGFTAGVRSSVYRSRNKSCYLFLLS